MEYWLTMLDEGLEYGALVELDALFVDGPLHLGFHLWEDLDGRIVSQEAVGLIRGRDLPPRRF